MMAAEFFRRWNDDALVEARRMFARYSCWEMWRPALAEAHGPDVYPMFEALAAKLAGG
jgi:hypothetical protein